MISKFTKGILILILTVATISGVGSILYLNVNAQGYDDYEYGDYDWDTYDNYYEGELDGGAAALLAGTSILIPLVCLCGTYLILGILAFIVYKDAKKMGVDNGVLWAVLTFFFGFIPMIIYFAAIRNKATGGPTTS